jgi:transposase
MTATESIPSYDLLVSLDRSDRTAALVLWDLPAAKLVEEQTLDLAPEALDTWWRHLCTRYPKARIAIAFEQPAPNLLAFFAPRRPAAIYALNPSSIWAYRQSLVVSRARNDESDARHQALYVAKHLAELKPWTPPPERAATLDRLCRCRRRQVDSRTALTNRLQAVLKRYFPQALELLNEDMWRPMNLEFLRKWPTAKRLQKVPLSQLRKFFHKHNSRSETRWMERAQLISRMVPLVEAAEPEELEIETLLNQIEVLNESIAKHDKVIAQSFEAEGETAQRVAQLPGAGPILAPRIYTALAIHAPNTPDSSALAAAVGIAPVTDQSGKKEKIYRRIRCDNHTRQTFVEWAKESWKHSSWAEAFVRQRQAKGHGFHSIIRALAYKWIRILWKCWQDGVAYDETKYLEQLRQKGSLLVPKTPAIQSA